TPLIHSDRGSQYTSKEYRFITTEAGVTRSMSRVGNCIDNAPIESFFGHLKCERYHSRHYKSYEELEQAIDEYIKFYNEERYQTKLNSLAPLEFRYQAGAFPFCSFTVYLTGRSSVIPRAFSFSKSEFFFY